MKKRCYCRTDLAVEWQRTEGEPLPLGVRYREGRAKGFSIFEMTIETDEGAHAVGKPCGSYITVELGRLSALSEERLEGASELIADTIRRLAFGTESDGTCTGDACAVDFSGNSAPSAGENDEHGCVLVVGLGNRNMTADAVGPATVDRITVTRHAKDLDPSLFESLSHRSVAAFCPGVLGQTGVESALAVKALAREIKPRLILAVDALAARSTDRLAATVQLSTGGIAPGSGVGNDRPAFTKESMGVPVLAIGVPMVVDSSTLVADALEKAGISELPEALLSVLEGGRSFFVSPKEVDALTDALADLLAAAIDRALAL